MAQTGRVVSIQLHVRIPYSPAQIFGARILAPRARPLPQRVTTAHHRSQTARHAPAPDTEPHSAGARGSWQDVSHRLAHRVQRSSPASPRKPLRSFFFFSFTLVTGPRRSLSLKLSDTRVYEPQIRARLGTTAHFCEVVSNMIRSPRHSTLHRKTPWMQCWGKAQGPARTCNASKKEEEELLQESGAPTSHAK